MLKMIATFKNEISHTGEIIKEFKPLNKEDPRFQALLHEKDLIMQIELSIIKGDLMDLKHPWIGLKNVFYYMFNWMLK